MAEHAAEEGVKHSYHLVDPSPWPIVGAVGAFILAFGLIMAMRGGEIVILGTAVSLGWLPLIVGAALVAFTMFGWWADVINEAQVQKLHTPIVQLGLRYGMILFIASEVMFFVAWFWAYFDAALFPGEAIQDARRTFTGGTWPPQGVQTFDPWDVPFINTLVLLTSGTTVTWAHHALLNGNRRGLIQGLGLTILLGMLFTSLQAYEYNHAITEDYFGFKDNIYGATFFMATGFHGFHVIVGTIFLLVCFFRALKGHFSPEQHFGVEAAAWYWHFVDVVWLFLFSGIYVAGAGAPPH
jgi:cytochrome c oxidase subunit 3